MKIKFHYECPVCGHKSNIIWAMLALSSFFPAMQALQIRIACEKDFPYTLFTFASFGIVLASYLQSHIHNGSFSRDISLLVIFGLFFGFELVTGLLMCNLATLDPVKITEKGKTLLAKKTKQHEESAVTKENHTESP